MLVKQQGKHVESVLLLKEGQRVAASADIVLAPYTTIIRSETGVIVDVCGELECCMVRWDVYHKGLAAWDNVAVIAADYLPSLLMLTEEP